MAIKTRTELKAWFLPSFKLITDRITAWFDSFIHFTDDVFIDDYSASDQEGDYTVIVTHNLHAEAVLVQLEDSDGNTNTGVNVKMVYVEDDGTLYTDSAVIELSDTIPDDFFYKIKILKIK